MIEPNESYEGTLDYIFASYDHADKEIAYTHIKALQDAGYRVWYDNGIELNDAWSDYLVERIQGCSCFMLFLSENSANSQYCGQEIGIAVKHKCQFAVINIDGIDLQQKHGALYGSLKDYQWMFRENFDNDVEFETKLASAPILEPARDIIEISDDGKTLIRYIGGNAAPRIPDGVEKIGDHAILTPYAKTITLPEGLKEIGESAFSCCGQLENIHLPDSVVRIREHAFGGCVSLARFDLPKSLTTIGVLAFDNCIQLKEIDFSGPGEKIRVVSNSFNGCSSLTLVLGRRLGNNAALTGIIADIKAVVEGPEYSHDGSRLDDELRFCLAGPLLLERNSDDLATKFSARATRFPSASLCRCVDKKTTSVHVPEYVTEIYSSAFEGCSLLEEIIIPPSASLTGISTFKDCTSLKSLHISESTTKIGASSFVGCTSLEHVYIPPSVTSINAEAFKGCTSLKTVDIPSSVIEIRSGAFEGCTLLKEISLPRSVDKIDFNTFDGCTSLENVALSDSLVQINSEAFRNCQSLKTLDIPPSVTKIGHSAFEGCSSLEKIVIPAATSSIDGHAFKNCFSFKEISILGPITKIESGLFENCTLLDNVTIPNTVTSIGSSAFVNCTSLSKITIPESNTFIDYNAFKNCKALESVNVPDSVTWMDEYVFTGCSSLNNAALSTTETKLREGIFSECSALKEIKIPESVTHIEKDAFRNCTSLERCILPPGLTHLIWTAFMNCTSLELTVPSQTILDEMRIPKGLKSLSFEEGSPYETDGATICRIKGEQCPIPKTISNVTKLNRERLENEAQQLLSEVHAALDDCDKCISEDKLKQINSDWLRLQTELADQRGTYAAAGIKALSPAIDALKTSSEYLISLAQLDHHSQNELNS